MTILLNIASKILTLRGMKILNELSYYLESTLLSH